MQFINKFSAIILPFILLVADHGAQGASLIEVAPEPGALAGTLTRVQCNNSNCDLSDCTATLYTTKCSRSPDRHNVYFKLPEMCQEGKEDNVVLMFMNFNLNCGTGDDLENCCATGFSMSQKVFPVAPAGQNGCAADTTKPDTTTSAFAVCNKQYKEDPHAPAPRKVSTTTPAPKQEEAVQQREGVAGVHTLKAGDDPAQMMKAFMASAQTTVRPYDPEHPFNQWDDYRYNPNRPPHTKGPTDANSASGTSAMSALFLAVLSTGAFLF